MSDPDRAATKPIYGPMAIAILISFDGVTLLKDKDRIRFLVAAIGLFAAFAIAYLMIYWHLAIRYAPLSPIRSRQEARPGRRTVR